MMKILNPTAYYDPEQFSSSHLNSDLENAFVDAGFECVVIAPTPSRGISDSIKAVYKNRLYEEKHEGKIKVYRIPISDEKRNPILRACRYAVMCVKQYIMSIKENNISVVYAVSTPPIQGWFASKIARKLSKKYKRKVPFVYNLQDMFPESLVTARLTHKGSLLWKLGSMISERTYKGADKIIAISENFKDVLLAKGVPEEKIEIVYNWIDTDNLTPVDRQENILFSHFGLPRDGFYICYSGNIGMSQNFEMLLDVADELKANSNIQFVIIGDGAFREQLVGLIESREIHNMHIFDFQPYEHISHVYSLGDADLVISKGGTGNSSVPSKTWSIMAAGRPVLASFDPDSELVSILNKAHVGVCTDADDKQALIKAIYWMYKNREQAAAMGAAGRRFVVDNLSRDKGTAKYVSVIKSAVESS